MGLDWSLLANAPNAGASFSQGFQQGQEIARGRAQSNALASYVRDPTQPIPANALAAFDPRDAMALVNDQRERELSAEKRKQEQQDRDLKLVGGLAKGSKTPEAWDAAVDTLVGMGYANAAEFKGKFSPSSRAALMSAAGLKDDDAEDYTLVPGGVRMRGNTVIAQSPYAPTVSADGVVYERNPTQPVTPSIAPNGQPRGIRNNNPGNIEDGPFARSQPGYKGTDGRFAIFETPEAGQSASSALLKSYVDRGINTPTAIISRWSPASENGAKTDAYTSYVSQRLGVDPNSPIPAEKLPQLATAMHEFETGQTGGGGLRPITPPKTKERAKPSETRVLKGRTYYKIDGRWFDNAEGS